NHRKTAHLPPSDPNYQRNLRGLLRRETRSRSTPPRHADPLAEPVGPLPGHGAAVAEEAAGVPEIGEVARPQDAGGALGDRATAPAAHVGGDPARTDGVDQDAVAPQVG